MKTYAQKILVLAFLTLPTLMLSNCGSGSSFDNPPNIAGAYLKVSENCTDTFLDMPDNLKVEQIGSEVELGPEIGLDLEGSVDNNGNINVDDSKEKTSCDGKFKEASKAVITLDCDINGVNCSAVYERN